MKKNLIFYLILLPFIFSCKKNIENLHKSLDKIENTTKKDFSNKMVESISEFQNIIVPNPKNTSYEFGNIIDKINFTKLELTNNSKIGKIDKLIIKNDRIFILDKKINKSVFVFTTEGKFIQKISNKGKGPGEYLNLGDLFVDKDMNIYISDLEQGKIIKYNSKGKLIDETILTGNLLLGAKNFIALKDGNYLFSTNNYFDRGLFKNSSFSLFKINKKGVLLSKNLEYLKENILIPYNTLNSFVSYNNKYNFLNTSNNSVYEVADNTIKLKYKIDFGQEGFSKEFLITENEKVEGSLLNDENIKAKSILRDKLDASDKSSNPMSFLETDSFIYFNYRKDGGLVPLFHNKITKSTFSSLDATIYESPLFILTAKCLPITVSNKKEFYGIIYPFEILQDNKNIKKQFGKVTYQQILKEYPKYENFIKTLNENDNPIISNIKFKNF